MRKTAAIFITLVIGASSTARIITVDDDAPADFNNIQAAIDDATDWDVVEIKPGTYTGPGNYDIRFNGKAITVRGTDPDDFDVVAETVIDCNNSRARGFTFDNTEDANSVLSGLTITNGDGGWSTADGGAIACDGGSPIITNCILTRNSGSGGAIGANEYSDPIVRNCIITHNTSSSGGGIFCTHVHSVMIENCIISHNTASKWGGGIRTTSSEPVVIRNCIITGNRARWGGGISSRGPDAVIIGCVVTGNVATEAGGGIYGRNYARLIVSNSIVSGNNAPLGREIAVAEPFSPIPEYNVYPALDPSYSNILGGLDAVYVEEGYPVEWGPGNIDADPCFADPGYWGHIDDPNIHVEANDPNATWVDGGDDYHLKSQAGRWDPAALSWALDDATSLCIDAGEPNKPLGSEPFPNGGRINLGIYGATAEASKSYFDKPPCETIVAGDVNGDCLIDGRDLALLVDNWLISSPLPPGQATNPEPPDGATDASGSVLTWTSGDGATSHDVYFGTTSPGSFQGNQTETTFDPGSLSDYTTYYWRIDEVNATSRTTGTVWSFTTGAGKPRLCFPADTLVWADGKPVPIVEVRPGQKVRMVDSAGEGDGKFAPIVEMRPGREVSVFNNAAEVEYLQEHGVGRYDCYDMTFETGNTLVVVHSHNFLTVAGEWVAVENLSSGSKLQSLNGPITITSVVKRAMPFVGNAYNLKIKGANLFFVGKDGVAAVDCSKLPKE